MLSRKKTLNQNAYQRLLGFTLIEVLVAIMVFASLSLAAYQVVNQVQRSNQQSAEKTQRLQDIQRAMIIMDSDFRQMAARQFRVNGEQASKNYLFEDEYLLDSESNGILFTRLGWLNPQQSFPRGEIVKVGYRVVQGNLERVWWRYPDTPAGQEPLYKSILTQVDDIAFRFYDGSVWQDEWKQPSQLPKAVEVTFTLQDYGKLIRVYLTAGGAASGNSNNDGDEQ
ncbi:MULTISPECIES: type II secretion system minor pseudopilin GspJ [Vibrio]|uniref:Type II secretion system protein J n=1 Tax=Vibrio casei TaxID=673372 RepID=A0A368LHF0_9VIBR|nr:MULTISPECIES: type II secretion system minor pseudopilin GspJ [Vibrio]RCS69200.1 type II secretion system protein GspJ [Vibrio casei]SJN37776.1 General secretion pathway protein J [Vibrio casei]HBV76277.1 type II secretion system protein GspJ [Vibrio sp.]